MNALAMGWERTLLELKMYSREKEAVFFNFLFPILLLVMFSTIFGGQFSAADKAAALDVAAADVAVEAAATRSARCGSSAAARRARRHRARRRRAQ